MKTTQIREVSIRYTYTDRWTPTPLRAPADVARYAAETIDSDPREHLLAVFLDARHQPIGAAVISIGTAAASLIHPRELLQHALMAGSCSIVIAHNHPTGNPAPSDEDRAVTRRLYRAAKIVGIDLLDHVVIGQPADNFTSLREIAPELFTASSDE